MRTSSAILCADVSGMGWVEKPKSMSGLVAMRNPPAGRLQLPFNTLLIRLQESGLRFSFCSAFSCWVARNYRSFCGDGPLHFETASDEIHVGVNLRRGAERSVTFSWISCAFVLFPFCSSQEVASGDFRFAPPVDQPFAS